MIRKIFFFLFAVIDCGKVPPMLYGAVEYTNSTTYLGSEIRYSCVKNYRLAGPSVRYCMENKQWSEGSPKCEGEVVTRVS